MWARCTKEEHPAFDRYGGKGITVTPEWIDVLVFAAWARTNGYAPELTLDREKNELGYGPMNCRWVTRTTQQRNRGSHRGSSSGYIGVCFHKLTGKWKAHIKVNKKLIHLGYHQEELEAAKARDQYILDNNLKDFTMNGVLP
jgi:hypothetical protein